jgi:hypothetical protein
MRLKREDEIKGEDEIEKVQRLGGFDVEDIEEVEGIEDDAA